MVLRIKIIGKTVEVEVDLSKLGFAEGRKDWVELQANEWYKGVKYEVINSSEIIVEIKDSIYQIIPQKHTTHTNISAKSSDNNIGYPVNKKLEKNLIDVFDEINLLTTIPISKEQIKYQLFFKNNLLEKYPIDKGTLIMLVADNKVYKRSVLVFREKQLCINFSKDELILLKTKKRFSLLVSEYKKNIIKKITWVGEKALAEQIIKVDPFVLESNTCYNANARIKSDRQEFLRLNRDQ